MTKQTAQPWRYDKQALRRPIVAQHYGTMSNGEIAKLVGASESTVETDAKAMGLVKPPRFSLDFAMASLRAKTNWTEPLKELFELMYPVMSNPQVSDLFGMSMASVEGMAFRMRLKKERISRPPKPVKKAVAAPRKKPVVAPTAYQVRGALPMSERQLTQRNKERITYPEGLPWRAQQMLTTWEPPALTHRGHAPI